MKSLYCKRRVRYCHFRDGRMEWGGFSDIFGEEIGIGVPSEWLVGGKYESGLD